MLLQVGALSLLLLLLCACAGSRIERKKVQAVEPLDYAIEIYRRTSTQLDPEDGYPLTTDADEHWRTTSPRGWTSGFYPGVLWHLYQYSQDPELLAQARRWTAGLEGQKRETGHHDVGFQIMSSFGNGYRLTGEEQYKEVILTAALSLATRYNERVGATRSWSWNPSRPAWKFPVIVDNMMNLELFFWAAKNGGDRSLYDMAVQHALTTRRCHVREDGSTYHLVDFDPETGDMIRGMTWQGYADESAWARGQAWAIYGFTMTYRETRDESFLATAQQVANYYIAHLPADHVPYWDFHAPYIPNEERDASAGAIAASALLELSTHVSSASDSERYCRTAENLLAELASPRYLTRGTGGDALLAHSVGSRPGNHEVDRPLIYADYYFVEALLRYQGLNP